MKHARMPDEPLHSMNSDLEMSVADGASIQDDFSEADISESDDSEDEREKRLKELQEQVSDGNLYAQFSLANVHKDGLQHIIHIFLTFVNPHLQVT